MRRSCLYASVVEPGGAPAAILERLERAMAARKWLAVVLPFLCMPLRAQDAKLGISMPVTLSGEAVTTHRLQTFAPQDTNRAVAFRAMLYPGIQVGRHAFAYSAVQVKSAPYFHYETYYPGRKVETELLQLFAGYTVSADRTAWSVKIGKLPSAFGSFPLQYDDTANSLLDAPLSYGYWIGLRSDQLPCGVDELLRQRHYRFVRFGCGGSTNPKVFGVWPVSLYGIPGVEFDLVHGRADARFQLTNSSPTDPLPLSSDSQQVQWTAGAGFTIRQGFRVGFSAFRGPYFRKIVEPALPPGKGVRNYPATGLSADVQWARGRWSTGGELQSFQFQLPGFRTSPVMTSGYVEAKSVITPRLYAAFRASARWHNRPEDAQEQSSQPFQANLQVYELALGFHINHLQRLKIGYEWMRTAGTAGTSENIFGVQFVTSIPSLSKAIW